MNLKRIAFVLLALFALTSVAFAQFADQAQWGGTSGGSANAQTLTIANYSSYKTGVPIRFLPGFTNTGALQVNINSLGLVNVLKKSPTGPIALVTGDIQASAPPQIVEMTYDGTEFQIIGPAVSSYNSRTGAVVPASGDYATSQLTTGVSGSSPSAGQIGETITNLGSSGVSIGNNTVVTLATVTLSAGDWNCTGSSQITLGISTVYTSDNIGITSTPASFPAFPSGFVDTFAANTVSASTPFVFPYYISTVIVRPTTSTSYSLVVQVAHSAGTVTGQGYLQCVRQD